MNNEELNASIQAYLNRKDTLVQLKEVEQPQALQSGGNTINFGWIYIFFWAIPIAILSQIGEYAGSGLGIIVGLFLIKKWCNEGEQIIKNETQIKTASTKTKKRKILFGEEDQI